jgi:hypothetical protein
VLAVAVAGCGSTTGSGPADPATLAPATTLAYASFEIAPQGQEKAGYDAAFGKLLGADPERRIGEALTKAARTSGRLDYAADVKPWLGETATAILTSVGSGHPDYALLLASTDDAKAQAAIDKDLGGANAASRKANPLIGAQYERVVAQVRASTGLDLEKDVIAAIGDVGVFIRGSSAASVGGGLVVQSPDGATLRRTVHRLPALIRRAGGGRARVISRGSRGFDVTSARASNPVQVRMSAGGAVAAYGSAALRAAEHPAGRLGDTPLFRSAAAAVGERPTLFVDFAPALNLAARSAGHRGGQRVQRVLPRLHKPQYLAVGVRGDGDSDVLRAVLGLR